MPDATINGQKTKPLPASTRAAMRDGQGQRKAVSTTTKPVSQVKVG